MIQSRYVSCAAARKRSSTHEKLGPYQHKILRIVEFPRYATYAQSFPNTIPYSEGLGFIAKVDDKNPKDIDYPFYITAHEVAHQWWAHQLVGGNTRGATVLSETLAEYSALMVMKKTAGPARCPLLRYDLNQYRMGAAKSARKNCAGEMNTLHPPTTRAAWPCTCCRYHRRDKVTACCATCSDPWPESPPYASGLPDCRLAPVTPRAGLSDRRLVEKIVLFDTAPCQPRPPSAAMASTPSPSKCRRAN